MTARSTTINEPTLQDKITYQLCEYANLVNSISKEDSDLERTLYQQIQQYLHTNQEVIGGWEIVWGPGVALFDTDLYAVNAMYMVRSTEDRSRYVIAMAGSTDALVFDWLVEDCFILQTPWFANLAASHTIGTAIGVKTLTNITPSGDRPGAGRTLPVFLSTLHDKAIDLTVTGHSLGGALSPTLALFLRDTQWLWDESEKARISVLSTAGPSFCNQEFVNYTTQRLQRVQRYANDLDIVPHMWNPPDIDSAKALYSKNNQPAPDGMKAMFDLLETQASVSGHYAHFDPASGVFQGTFNKEISQTQGSTPDELYLQQVGYQHIGGYHQFFEIEGAQWPQGVVALPPVGADTGMGRILASAGVPLGDGAGKILANRRPVTVPINGQPVELPTDHDSPQAKKLVDRVTAEFDPTAA
ncbi:lipase family protein [Nocardia sp. NBC_00881]|uniref:lipase family protein n=1 Tax=Nocardia sp. NBC_00881 TaxID=2975995 RepID=UPI00386E5682|nr:lipase family protein [Nocardia sp. NBC_00881]